MLYLVSFVVSKGEFAKYTTFLVPYFISTLTNFIIKILIGKIPLYPYQIKPKTTLFFPHDFFKSQIQIERYPVINSNESDDVDELFGADEFSGEIRRC